MEKAKKARTILRRCFTKQHNIITSIVNLENPNLLEIKVAFSNLEEKFKEMRVRDKEIFDFMLENETTIDEELEDECMNTDEYVAKFNMVQENVRNLEIKPTSDNVSQLNGSMNNDVSGLRRFRLPRIEIKQFNGEIREWFQFWGLFKKVDEDMSIDNEEKYQYLVQATVPGSRARIVVESFPPTGDNYPKAIEALKARFGREDLLIEVYVRELLSLVLQKSLTSTFTSLTTLYDKLECQMRALDSLGVTTDKCSSMLFPLVESCLPEELLRVWQRSNTALSDDRPQSAQDKLKQLMAFIRMEVENEEKVTIAMAGFGNMNLHKKKSPRSEVFKTENISTAAGLLTTSSKTILSCVFCNRTNHKNHECVNAQKIPWSDKKRIIIDKACCFICLRPGHIAKKCHVYVKCSNCQKRHSVVMCPELESNKKQTVISEKLQAIKGNAKITKESSLTSLTSNPEVLLQTVNVILRGNNGIERQVRALFDTASQRSYIIKDTAVELDYESFNEEKIIHSLFGGLNTGESTHKSYKIHLSSLDRTYHCNFVVLDQSEICGEICTVSPGPWEKELSAFDIILTDNKPNKIELLIGADVAGKLLSGRVIQLQSGLTAIETFLGWTLMGKYHSTNSLNSSHRSTAILVTSMLVNNMKINDLWELDVLGIRDPCETDSKKQLELAALKHFQETVSTNAEGRYVVHLPWVEGHLPLPTNYNLSQRRLESTIKKLKIDGYYAQYENVFNEWLDEEIIEEVPVKENDIRGHYLPHRHVIKLNSTTKVRPVFDASAHEKQSPSLNNCLEKGINLLEHIPTTLFKFRLNRIGVISDIRKAFLQIELNVKDRDFLRFLWKTSAGELKVYRHRRVVFGVTSSPFLLGAVIQHHLGKTLQDSVEGTNNFSRHIIEKLRNSFYVDNCVTSVNTELELTNFIKEAREIMNNGKFDLRGWESSFDCTTEAQFSNVLGLTWDRLNDTLSICTDNILNIDYQKVTKRTLLSVAHRVFDPIGFTCPVTLCPKLLLQLTWVEKLGWEDTLNEDITQKFLKWAASLSNLNKIKIPRYLPGVSSRIIHTSIHTFCDASKTAYAAVSFLRVQTESEVNVQLIQAKSRVAPINKITTPRLELLAATIGSRLSKTIRDANVFRNVEFFFWTDSSTVLAWLNRNEQWGVFIRNRIDEILKLTSKDQWRYVPGNMNPADLPSRGCSTDKLIVSRWWEGPDWLKLTLDLWPMNKISSYDEDEIKREKIKTVTSCVVKDFQVKSDWYFRYFSKYNKIIRLVGWIRRFIHNTRNKKDRMCDDLTRTEVTGAETIVLKMIQECFSDYESDKSVLSLCPFKDELGLLRVKTKLINREDNIDFRCPILLPPKHPVVERLIYEEHVKACHVGVQGLLSIELGLLRVKTKLINREDNIDFRCPILLPPKHPVVERLIYEEHVKACHVGVQGLLSIIRERFWIIGGRRTVRSVISKCISCKRFSARSILSTPAPLPLHRVKDAAAFEVVGVDLAGPLFLKTGQKCWVALFTCAVYRAIHLELLSSLSTEVFIQSLRRFIARRGRPSVIYSDNGTNFIGTNNAFKRLDWLRINNYSTAHRFDWKFNPPTAAWWGGWWERLIRLLKQLLKRTLGKSCLNFEEMLTILCDCEAVINSRPITYISESTIDLSPLTPAMFIQDIREIGVPDCDKVDAEKLSNRAAYRKKLCSDLRKRFRIEYLGELRHHYDGNSSRSLRVGEIVLVGNDNSKRLDWPIARIVEIITGKDNCVRLVRLRVSTGELLRPVQRIFPLEIESELNDNTQANDSLKIPSTNLIKTTDVPQKRVVSKTRSGRIVKLPIRY